MERAKVVKIPTTTIGGGDNKKKEVMPPLIELERKQLMITTTSLACALPPYIPCKLPHIVCLGYLNAISNPGDSF